MELTGEWTHNGKINMNFKTDVATFLYFTWHSILLTNCEELGTLCTVISRKTTIKVILKGITIIKVIEKDSICLYKNMYMNVQSISIHYSKNNKQSKSPSTGEWIF